MTMLVVLLITLPGLISSLQCYYCDTARNVSCPGWERCATNYKPSLGISVLVYRPPIDSVKTKLDVVGLFNHCVTVKLADGRIIEQNIYPGSTHCQEIFLQSWTMLLNSQWNQVTASLCWASLLTCYLCQDVTVDCCTEELCNGPRDKTLAWSQANYLSSPLTLLLVTLAIWSSLLSPSI